jgi:hypothetical protein
MPRESIGTVVSTHETIRAAFKANEPFQKRMRESGVKDHVPTKIVTLKVRLGVERLRAAASFNPFYGWPKRDLLA